MRKKNEGLKTKNFFRIKSEKKFFDLKVSNKGQPNHLKLLTIDRGLLKLS